MESELIEGILVVLEVFHPADREEVAQARVQMLLVHGNVVWVAVSSIRRICRVGCRQSPYIHPIKVKVLEHRSTLASLKEDQEFTVSLILVHVVDHALVGRAGLIVHAPAGIDDLQRPGDSACLVALRPRDLSVKPGPL